MGGGTSKNDDPDEVDVSALVAKVRRNERNVFEIPFPVHMTKGKKNGQVLTVPCAPTETVWNFKERIAAASGDDPGELTLAYGPGDKHEGKMLFIEDKGPKSFKFDETRVTVQQCRCTKNTQIACTASKEINLDAYDDETHSMLTAACNRGLKKPMQSYVKAYKQAVNQWVDEHGLPDREEEKGGRKVPYEHFHCEAVKHATLQFADPRKHKTWAHKFRSIKARDEAEKSTKSNEIFHVQARKQVDDFLAVFFDQVEKALAAFPPYIEGHRELVWDRLNEVIDNRIYGLVEEHKQHMMDGQMKRIKNAIYAKLWFDDDVDSLS
eukprot:INCI12103.1.p1 GENE.INCI12103.1~~INCI12103.1.p1  ORF type:complete len:323 (-),score=69.15 INCI12103.1:491-1459(-)